MKILLIVDYFCRAVYSIFSLKLSFIYLTISLELIQVECLSHRFDEFSIRTSALRACLRCAAGGHFVSARITVLLNFQKCDNDVIIP